MPKQKSLVSQSSFPLVHILSLVALFFLGYFLVKSMVTTPDVNKIDADIINQFQSRFGSASPVASTTFSPYPSASALISGNKGCVIKCVMGGTGYKKCQDKCKSGTPTTYSNSN